MGKCTFAEELQSTNSVGYRSENNFVRPLK